MLEKGIFPEDWKKSDVVPVHKKESTNLMKNYRAISLLPIFSKIFERLILNSLFNYFIQNKLLTECQSGFIPGDSCVAHFWNFLDISKVWHERLRYHATISFWKTQNMVESC